MPVVRDLNINVSPAEIVALMGANGVGKTTVLMTLAGLLSPLQGDVLGWRACTGVSSQARSQRTWIRTRIEDHLREPVGGEQPSSRPGDPAHALEYFPELWLMNRRAGLLSGGEQQMLTLGRALAAKPALLLFDELSLGLAPAIVQRLIDVLKQAKADGIGILLVEQHVKIALSIADRAYVLQRGRVALEGSAADLAGRASELRHTYLANADARV